MAVLIDVPTNIDPAMYNFLMQLKRTLDEMDKRIKTLEEKP